MPPGFITKFSYMDKIAELLNHPFVKARQIGLLMNPSRPWRPGQASKLKRPKFEPEELEALRAALPEFRELVDAAIQEANADKIAARA